MAQRPDAPPKKPMGGRPGPRRLFSFESLRREKSNSTSDSTTSQTEQPPKNGSMLRLVERIIPEESGDPFAFSQQQEQPWMDKPMVETPAEIDDEIPRDKRRKRVSARPSPLHLEGRRASEDGITGPQRRRWDTVRHHVLPTAPEGSAIPTSPFEPPSSTRSATPKGYLFGPRRNNMRQIVEDVRVVDDVRKFSEDIQRACWTVRFGEPVAPGRIERDGSQGTTGSGINLPFIGSTSSLPMSSSASVASFQMSHGSRGALRRPPSLQSLALTTSTAASVTQIARALTSTTSINRPRKLPHEDLIWSALLVPFLSPSPAMQVDHERATAVETFQMAIKMWKAQSNEDELERCLWCCKAASVPSQSRARIVGSTLQFLLSPQDKPFFADTPILLQTLLKALISLLVDLSRSQDTIPERQQVSNYLSAISGEGGVQLSKQSIEREYGVRFSRSDKEDVVRSAIFSETVVKCLEIGHESRRHWILCHLLETYWPKPEPNLTLTPLLACIYWRKLKIFITSALTFLSPLSDSAETVGDVIIRLFRWRVIPEVEAMRTDDAAEIRSQVIRLMLELLSVQGSEEKEYILMHFCDWYQNKDEWKESIHSSLMHFIKEAEWAKIVRTVPVVSQELPDEVQQPIVAHIIPLLFERLATDAPPPPVPRLSEFLIAVSQKYPKIFFKPLFACAGATKDITAINHLHILSGISKFVPQFWMRDPEMLAVALVGDSGGQKPKTPGDMPAWGKSRIGQSVLLVEVVHQLSATRNLKDMAQTAPAVKFAIALEARLSAMIAVKEQTMLIPDVQRILYCNLFREIRLLTRSLKPAGWLFFSVTWFTQLQAESGNVDKVALPTGDREDLGAAFKRLEEVYTQARDFSHTTAKRGTVAIIPQARHHQRSTSAGARDDTSKASPPNSMDEGLQLIRSLSRSPQATVLELFVCVSALLSPEDYVRLVPVLWYQCMDGKEVEVIMPTCFLVMQCAEKGPTEFTHLLEADLSSVDPDIRCRTLVRFGTLSSWRYQLLSQEVILDRTHRRPFKLMRPPIHFVATDIGSSQFVYEEDDDGWKDTHGHVLPLELRRRLSEIGWEQEGQKIDQKTQWIQTPMALLPTQQLDKLDSGNADAYNILESASPAPSPEPSPSKSHSKTETTLMRQDSSTTGRAGIKRRPVFVMTLISLFPRLASMLLDRDYAVSSAAIDLILDFMRDDPSLLARSAFHLISGEQADLVLAVTTLRAFLHVRHVLPPGMAHHTLNHLTGFLKSAMKHTLGSADPLQSYAYAMPIIANLVTQVCNLSVRDIRRAKIDPLLIPTGSLWFLPTAPMGPQFPRSLKGANNPFETFPSKLIWITLIRTSQNRLFVSMLKRDPQDVKVIRKHMTRLILPTLDDSADDTPLALADMLPQKPGPNFESRSASETTLNVLSTTLARSYLLLICQVFQVMSRHLNDRNELAVLMDGVNRIMITHGNDINIVAHSMMAYMMSSTRFRRLFTSNGGYTLFMPTIIKVYVEAEHNQGIRAAIEYAINRFYALHEDSFLFQTFNIVSNMITMPNIDAEWAAKAIYALFSTLRFKTPPIPPEAAGIQGMNRSQEKEALMMSMVEQVPQTLVDSLKRGDKQSKTHNPMNVPIPEEYEGKRLSMDNLIRLFLTVIAHNPAVQRAERFLRLLCLLAPDLYHASNSTRTVLRDGILALANIMLTKSGGKNKAPESGLMLQPQDPSMETLAEGGVSRTASQSSTQSQSVVPSDMLAMRLDYLSLVVAYIKAGGLFNNTGSQRILEVVKTVLRDPLANNMRVSTFIAEYARCVLIRDPLPPVKQVNTVLSDFAPIVSAYSGSVDFSGLYGVVTQLAENSVFATEPSFAELVVRKYCRYGLEACELAASENILLSLPLRVSLLKLINAAVSMPSLDVMEEISNRIVTYHFMSGIVLPLVLMLKTPTEATCQPSEAWRREPHSRAWAHLLTYVLRQCQSAEEERTIRKPTSPTDRRKLGHGGANAGVKNFAMALQTLKAIVTRAEDEISATMPGIWARMGGILKAILADGNASFALRRFSFDYSEPPSPSFSPRNSSFSQSPNFPTSPSMHQRKPLSPPRVIDYLTWSFIQWLWLRRNPLRIQMRIFVQERVATLAQDLRQGHPFNASIPSTPQSQSRRVSSIFSKPRKSQMLPSPSASVVSTPRTSAFLTSTSMPLLTIDTSAASLFPSEGSSSSRLAGYARGHTPSSPQEQKFPDVSGGSGGSGGPKIVHLGPINTSASANLLRSPGGTRVRKQSVQSIASEIVITSPTLTRTTYRRIRLVQHLMGYRELLPLADNGEAFGEDDDPASDVKAWTKRDALEVIAQETKELLDEFKEDFEELGEESMVVVEPEPMILEAGPSP